MPVCCLECPDFILEAVKAHERFQSCEIRSIQLPITASNFEISHLIVSPSIGRLERLSATISDWNLPPATLLVIENDDYEARVNYLEHHPRMGRSVFFCRNTESSLQEGLHAIADFHDERESLQIDNTISGHFNMNNISPRWLFHSLMEHMDEYIYFKDKDCRFLAVSQYLAKRCGKTSPGEVLGLTDFELFDQEHAQEAFIDEQKIISGEIAELHKEEHVTWDGHDIWVSSRKLPLHTRSGYLAGSFGLSRDVTSEKVMHAKIESDHERMQGELILARNLQDQLMNRPFPKFIDEAGKQQLALSTRYIPSYHLSGDYCAVIKTPSGGAGVLIADVMGHGVRAAMITAMLQVAMHQLEYLSEQPAAFMQALNQILHDLMKPCGQVFFATAAYCFIDIQNQTMHFTQAGARHGIFIASDSKAVSPQFEKNPICPALGLMEGATFQSSESAFQSGDQLLLFTDGIIEASLGDEEFGLHRVKASLETHRTKTPDQQLEALLHSLHQFTQKQELEDDLCLMALRMP